MERAKYKIISSGIGKDFLEGIVNGWVSEGWIPKGGIQIDKDGKFHQAIFLPVKGA